MDGKALTEMFLDAVNKPEVDLLQLNARAIYRALDAAAIEFARLTRILTGEATIESVAAQQRYDLPPDFIDLYVYDGNRRLIVKYVDGDAGTHWPVVSTFEKIFRAAQTTARAYPSRIAVVPRSAGESRITGTTTSAGAQSAGEAALNDTAQTFLTTVQARDTVHDIAQQSSGLIVSVPSDILAMCAMFGGKSSGFASGDSYVIVPAATHQLLLDSPSEDSNGEFTIPYVKMPPPVYSDYATWGFPEQSCRAICEEAAFKFLSGKKAGKPTALHHKDFIDEVRQTRNETAMRLLQGDQYLVRM